MAAESRAPLVGIIIPLYNGRNHIAETVQAALSQTHPALQVIVLDDGSSDGGAAVVTGLLGDSRLTLHRKANEGIARTRNEGLRMLDSVVEYVVFMDHDDVVHPELVAKLLTLLQSRPDATAAFAVADWIDAQGARWMSGEFARFMRSRETVRDGRLVAVAPDQDAELVELFLSNHLYPPSGILMRRTAIDAVGGFDPHYRVADDWDALIRLSRSGPIAALDEELVGYRRHGANASGNTALNVRESRAIWARTFHSPDNDARTRRMLGLTWRVKQRQKFHAKSADARRLLGQGHPMRALRREIDAVAHLALWRPLRRWGR